MFNFIFNIVLIYTKIVFQLYTPFILLFAIDFLNSKNIIKNSTSCTYEIKSISVMDASKSYAQIIYIIYNNILVISLYNYYTFTPNVKHVYYLLKKLIKAIILSYLGLSILSYNILKHFILSSNKSVKLFLISLAYKTSCDLKIYKINNVMYFNPLSKDVMLFLSGLPQGQKDIILKHLVDYYKTNGLYEIQPLSSVQLVGVPRAHYSIKNLLIDQSSTSYLTDYHKAESKQFYGQTPVINKIFFEKESTVLQTNAANVISYTPSDKLIVTKTIVHGLGSGYTENIINPKYINIHNKLIELYNLLMYSMPGYSRRLEPNEV